MRKRCTCQKPVSKVPPGWNPPPCHFQYSLSKSMRPASPNSKNILRRLICVCGAEIGDLIFSGKQRCGHWRLDEAFTINSSIQSQITAYMGVFVQKTKEIVMKLEQGEQVLCSVNAALKEMDQLRK